MTDYYQPLTPKFRSEINESIDQQISELRTCKNNGLVQAQITGYKIFRNLIKSLPDGYPIPMKKRR